ncbi:hypothetical protein D3C84_841770 [compost metagenome]
MHSSSSVVNMSPGLAIAWPATARLKVRRLPAAWRWRPRWDRSMPPTLPRTNKRASVITAWPTLIAQYAAESRLTGTGCIRLCLTHPMPSSATMMCGRFMRSSWPALSRRSSRTSKAISPGRSTCAGRWLCGIPRLSMTVPIRPSRQRMRCGTAAPTSSRARGIVAVAIPHAA